jgi:hypothetical protein
MGTIFSDLARSISRFRSDKRAFGDQSAVIGKLIRFLPSFGKASKARDSEGRTATKTPPGFRADWLRENDALPDASRMTS